MGREEFCSGTTWWLAALERKSSTAAFAMTIFMIASPNPVQETPPASRSA
jgi:hypothetical protein